jgi:peptide/nickel transport system permease protein
MENAKPYSFAAAFWKRFKQHRLGYLSLWVIALFVLVGIYAPFLASNKPLIVKYDGEWYFPLFRYLFFTGFYTKRLDIFFNILIFTFPLYVLTFCFIKSKTWIPLTVLTLIQFGLFFYFAFGISEDPASNKTLNQERQKAIQQQLALNDDPYMMPRPSPDTSWDFELKYMTPYAKLNQLVQYVILKKQNERLMQYAPEYESIEISRFMQYALEEKKASLRRQGAKELPSDEVLKSEILKELTPEEKETQFSIPTLFMQRQIQMNQNISHLQEVLNADEGQHQKDKSLIRLMINSCLVTEFKNAKQDIKPSTASKISVPEGLQMPTEPKGCIWMDDPRYKSVYDNLRTDVLNYDTQNADLHYLLDKQEWLKTKSAKLEFMVMPLISWFHWEQDAGGKQSFNQIIDWDDLTRTNRKDLMAALIFGVRISIVVGIVSVVLALIIGIPIGAMAGFYGGTTDIITLRLVEIWESMPTFFMLLLVVAMLQSKSIFIVISVIGIFGWTGFCRFTRGEFFKQRNLPYVESCRALGFSDSYTMFSHILPNAIPPILTLMPFAIMGAISSEAGLSFLGLGEEGSCSWGVLMDEGREAFPAESYLLWPPAILLTILLVAIALVGDALRDALDPKLNKS